jgi:hypothetical protein
VDGKLDVLSADAEEAKTEEKPTAAARDTRGSRR